MVRHSARWIGCVILGLGTALAAIADDTKSSEGSGTKSSSADIAKGPDFSAYATVTKVLGEVVTANESSATIRIFWEHLVSSGNGNRGNGNRGRRPQLHGNHGRGYQNPYMMRRPNVKVKVEHHDYALQFVPEALVRVKRLPPKINEDGKKGNYTQKELAELKIPNTAPGYMASKSDLTPGTVVEAYVVRDKTIPASKVTEANLMLKYVVIVGQDPNPPKDIINPPSNGKKKK